MKSEDKKKQYCPICGTEVQSFQRYPDYLCHDCVSRITDREGRRVDYFNDNFMGFGCSGIYHDTKEPYDSDHCFIDGVECSAKEARFGGIVIQAIKKKPEANPAPKKKPKTKQQNSQGNLFD